MSVTKDIFEMNGFPINMSMQAIFHYCHLYDNGKTSNFSLLSLIFIIITSFVEM